MFLSALALHPAITISMHHWLTLEPAIALSTTPQDDESTIGSNFYPHSMTVGKGAISSIFFSSIFFFISLSAISIIHLPAASAEDCVVSACLSVYTQDGQIIIEGRKDAAAPVVPKKSWTPRPTPAPFSSPTTTHEATVNPLPAQTSHPSPTPTPTVTKKKWIPKIVTKVASVSLNDRLIKILPIANIVKQPSSGAIVGVSVIFWCDVPTAFAARVAIIGEVIDVSMRPSFFWSFGDGSIQVTTESGRPFPHQTISHTYANPGTYPVVLMATWEGTWIHNGIARAITGNVRKTTLAIVSVQSAPTRFKR